MSLDLDFIDQPSLQTKKRSLSLETLIQQNEDLQARLRVALRNLSEYENQNETLSIKLQDLQGFKDSFDHELDVKEERIQILLEKISMLEADLGLYQQDRQKIEKQERLIQSLLAYRSKIQKEVKPYLLELKALADKLADSESKLKVALRVREKEAERFDSRLQNLEGFYQAKIQKIEHEKTDLLKQVDLSLRIADELEKSQVELIQARELVDQFQNQVVFLERSLEEERAKNASSWDEQVQQTRSLKSRIGELEFENKELASTKSFLESELKSTKEEFLRQQEQLDTTRSLWAEQNKELEKLQQRLQSLEKLNADLSSRLNSVRKGSPTL